MSLFDKLVSSGASGALLGESTALANQSRAQEVLQMTQTMRQSMLNSAMQHQMQMLSAQAKNDQALTNEMQHLASDMQSNAQANMKSSLQKLSQSAAA